MRTYLVMAACAFGVAGARPEWKDLGSDELDRYFEQRVAELENPLAEIETADDWNSKRGEDRRQLLDMLGLDPLPERTPLHAVVTGKVERDEFTVENLHFQSSPGLYVTANLYLPAQREGRVPVVLYVCGHGPSKKDDVSFGNKVTYQHHGIWFARNGYACLVIDSLQLGEIEAIHHGLYRYDRWWWISRGYTPAGVEAWNCMRALDYLQARPEIDGERIGVTGRSGGGAYSWWIAATDERIAAAVPVAGITSLRDHVVEGCIEGHCDCMYQLNTYGWDFEVVAALVAPRPLLISNTDKDGIFPIEGVSQVFLGTRHVYDLLGASDKLGLNIEEGPHKDTQPLRVSAFHWMNRHLKGAEPTDTFAMAAEKMLEPEELKVFAELPADEINTTIDETFGPSAGEPVVPESAEEWEAMRDGWATALKEDSFRGWPEEWNEPEVLWRWEGRREGLRTRQIWYAPQPEVRCSLFVVQQEGTDWENLTRVELRVVGEESWQAWQEGHQKPDNEDSAIVYLCPRGIGEVAWEAMKDERKRTQIRRRFPLVGQSLDGMRVRDIVQGIRMLRSLVSDDVVIAIEASGAMAGNALYASLFLDKPVEALTLRDLPPSHLEGPYYLNVLRHLDLPQAVALAAERSSVTIHGDPAAWSYPRQVAEEFDWPAERLVLKRAEPESAP